MPTSELIGISGSGVYFPRKTIMVDDLAKIYHVEDRQILKNQGIKKVHVADSKETEFYMATEAVKKGLKDSQIEASDVNVVIYCKGIRQQKTARTFSSRLIQVTNMENAYGFDIDGGFIGGLIGLQVANDIIKNSTQIRNALVVASQEFDELYLFGGGASRVKHMIFGDGAAAVVLSAESEYNKILCSNFVTDHYTNFIDMMMGTPTTSGLTKFVSKVRGGSVVEFKGQSKVLANLSERWVKNAYSTLNFCMKEINLDISDINHLVKTQLSPAENDMFCKRLQISPDKIHSHASDRGHLGHADMLANLDSTLKNKQLNAMDIVALVTANYDGSSGTVILRK